MMHEISCHHGACRCTLSSSSPEPYCCDYCEDHMTDRGRCGCGHDACGGVAGVDRSSSILVNPERDLSINRPY